MRILPSSPSAGRSPYDTFLEPARENTGAELTKESNHKFMSA